MPNSQAAINQLKQQRSALRLLYLTARQMNDQAEQTRLVSLAGEIDDLIDELVFGCFQGAAARLDAIARKIAEAKQRVQTIDFSGSPTNPSGTVTPPQLDPVTPTGNGDSGAETGSWETLIAMYRTMDIEFPNLKAVTLAQWIIESGRGSSRLAKEHNNYAGMKWRSQMEPYGRRVLYNAHDGSGYYTHFDDLEAFVKGFWVFLDRSPYDGWRNHVSSAGDYIEVTIQVVARTAQTLDFIRPVRVFG